MYLSKFYLQHYLIKTLTIKHIIQQDNEKLNKNELSH